MPFLAYLPFGLLPSFIWLSLYLRKDDHPESKWMILKIFFYGMLATIPAAMLELGIFEEISKLSLSENIAVIIYFFLGVALTEEIVKYLIVRVKVLNNPEFDEPTDVMIYMIVAALGFAALENISILLGYREYSSDIVFKILLLRFVGATFLHALASGTMGYFIARSLFQTKQRGKLLLSGLIISTTLHGLYNLSIIQLDGNLKLAIPAVILIILAIVVTWGFNDLKKLKSVCKIV
ncbi:MAG: PrsW family intramembrane metalloprotease [Candidatus Parcubacteria bacterium]|nr:PrsW family intramembrane metalloprotease [Candidatus Parcubacteria bacterium]